MVKAADDLKNSLYHRHISQDGRIELGIHPVIFGYRVRAGFINSGMYELDWCGGDKQSDIELLFTVAKRILTDRTDFKGIPAHSKIKPFYKDSEFVTIITELSAAVKNNIELEKILDITIFRKDQLKRLNEVQL